MKKILLVAAIASTFMAFADGETANATEVQQIGITAITTSRPSVIVAFSYKGSDGEDLTADKLVKTTNLTARDDLTAGDELIAYKGKDYMSWELMEDKTTGSKYWGQPIVVKFGEEATLGDAASTLKQAVGTGIWLKRQKPVDDDGNAIPFYIYGTPTDQKTITVAKGTTMLIGNPNSSKTSPTIENASQGDVVYIPNDTGTGFATYTYGANKMWNKGLTALASLPGFDANTGAWYQSKGSEKNVTITW